MDKSLVAQEMAATAAAIDDASHAQDREALMRALASAITSLMAAYGAAFGEVPPWAPEPLRRELQEALTLWRHR